MYRFGIIGFGKIGIRHWAKIQNHEKCSLVAIADINNEVLMEINEEGVQKFSDYRDLLAFSEVDVVAICTPNNLHAIMTIEALKAKKHVICEKPMSLKALEGKKMINAALKYDKKLFIVKQNRYNPPIKAIHELIEKEQLGKIFSIVVNCYWNRNDAYYDNSPWKGDNQKDGGALYTQFSHFIDLMFWLANEDVISVYALANNYNHPKISIEDGGAMCVQFENDIIATVNFTNCSYGRNMEGSITLFAEKGTVKIGGQYLNELEYQNIEGIIIDNLPKSVGPNDYGEYKGTMSNHHLVYENVVNTLDGKEVIDVNGIEGMKTIEIIEAAYKSAKEKRVVFL